MATFFFKKLRELGKGHSCLGSCLGLGQNFNDRFFDLFEFCLSLDKNLLIFKSVLFCLMLVHLCRPDYLGLKMAQNILLDCELNHLCGLSNWALAYLFRATNLQELGASIPASRNHAQVICSTDTLQRIVIYIIAWTRLATTFLLTVVVCNVFTEVLP